MRMWMVPPPLLCRSHLLGEHRELHALAGMMKKGIKLDGYVKNSLIETGLIWARHDHLVHEMLARGYNHHSPLEAIAAPNQGTVDGPGNLRELHRRCQNCRERIDNARAENR